MIECECIEYIGTDELVAATASGKGYVRENIKFTIIERKNNNIYAHWGDGWLPSATAGECVDRFPKLHRLADCNRCKHKMTCLLEPETMVAFEATTNG